MQVPDYSWIESLDTMKLRDEDKQWLRTEIADQVAGAIAGEVDKFRPQGARRVGRFVREWGLAAALITAPIALLGLAGTGWYYALSRVERQATFQATAEERLKLIEATLKEIQLKQIASNPADPDNIKAAKALLAVAQTEKFKIASSVIETAGKRFLQVAQKDPQAWPAAQDFLGYRSFLNADFVPNLGQLTPATGNSKYSPDISITHIFSTPARMMIWFAGGYATSDKSARLEKLSAPHREGSEFTYFVLEGGPNATIGLDGFYLKNVIVRNSSVSYDGGPVRLENVYFVNCTFTTTRLLTPQTVDFGLELLANVPTSYQNSGALPSTHS